VVTGALFIFYGFVVLLLLLMAAMLAVPLFGRQLTWRKANWWLYPVMVAAVSLAIVYKNIDVVRADMLLKQGDQYRAQQQYDVAIDLHKQSIQLDPDEDFYYLMLALDYQMKAQDGRVPADQRAQAWVDGEQIALKARQINIYNPDNTGNMGRYYLTWAQMTSADDPEQKVRFEKALDYFERATHLAPQNVLYYNLLAQTYYVLGDYDQALTALQASAALDPEFDQTQMLLGDTYGALGQPDQAAEAHRKAIMMSPAIFADAGLDQRLDFYSAYGRMDDIIQAYMQVAEEKPKQKPLALRTLGHIYARMGDHAKAIAAYESALQAGDTNLQTVAELAGEYLATEDFERAAQLYEQLVAQEENNTQIHSNLGYVYARLGRLEDAIRENQRVIELNPNDYISHRNLVLLYRDSGQTDLALQQANQMLAVTPDQELGPSYLLVGTLYEAADRWDEAINAYQQAINADPGLAQAHAALGNAYLRQQQPQAALDAFLALAELTPDDYAVHQQLALLYSQLGQPEPALVEARLALSLAPEEAQPALEQLVAQLEAGG